MMATKSKDVPAKKDIEVKEKQRRITVEGG